MTPPYPMADVLIRGAADGDGVSNGIHDVLPVGGRCDDRALVLRLGSVFGGRRWWTGERRVGGVPGESWNSVGRVGYVVGWVAERISGGRSVPRMML